MGIGAYRHRVLLEHPAVVLDPADWYCSLQSAASQVIDGLSAFYVRGRFHPGITLETQITFEGRTFQVQSVTDVDERHTELQLMCVEVVGRGTTPVPPPPVGVAPTITTQPVGSTIALGASVTLTVVAAGTPPLAYQWTLAGVDIAGATSASYMTGPLTTTAIYAVRVSNAFGSVTSAPATVVVEVPSPLLTNLVSYWKLDEASGTRADAHGPNPLTDHNGVGSAAGKIANGAAFVAASAQSLTYADATAPLGDEDFTYALWINQATINPSGGMVVTKDDVSGRSYGIYVNSGARFWFNADNPRADVLDAPGMLVGTWYFLVAWHDATANTISLQVNNGPMSSAPTGGVFPNASAVPVRIGARQYPGFEQYFNGLIDEVGLWRRVLTPAERTQLYNAGNGLTYPFA
jgi:hypothetical protein